MKFKNLKRGQFWQRLKRYARFNYLKIYRIKDSPQKIAQGVALGTALDFLPIPIISIIVAYITARILKFNSVAAVLSAIFFKWAVPFFYAFNLVTGNILMGNPGPPDISHTPLPQPETIDFITKLKSMGYPFFLGSVVNAVLVFILVFYLVNRILAIRQQKKLEKNKALASENKTLASKNSK